MDPFILSPAMSCLDIPAMAMVWIGTLGALATACDLNSFWLICLLVLLFGCFLQFVYESAYMGLPFCSLPFLLRLPDLSLPYLLQSAFFETIYSLHHVVYLALYDDNTDMHLTAYLLVHVCTSEVLFTICVYAYINIYGAP